MFLDRHINNVLVSAQHFVAHIQGQLKTKAGHLLTDHNLGYVIFHPKFISLGYACRLILSLCNFFERVTHPVSEWGIVYLRCKRSFCLGAELGT